jgi:Repeat of Unknown Function (DUF347)
MPFSLAALLTLIQRLSRIKVLGNIGENSLSNLFANGSLIEQGNQSLAANDPAAGELTREDPILLAACDILRDREVMRFQTQPPHALCIPNDGAALMFGAALADVAAAYFWTKTSRVLLFWAAFILTRPLGATVCDSLDKPVDHGGLALSRPIASAVIAILIFACSTLIPQRTGNHPRNHHRVSKKVEQASR